MSVTHLLVDLHKKKYLGQKSRKKKNRPKLDDFEISGVDELITVSIDVNISIKFV